MRQCENKLLQQVSQTAERGQGTVQHSQDPGGAAGSAAPQPGRTAREAEED